MKNTDRFIQPQFAFPYKNQELHVEKVPVSKLVRKYGSPLYIYSAAAIRESYRRLARVLKGLPIQVCYAVKANSNIHILEVMKKLGAGCDLVSYGEWVRAELSRIPRAKRVFSGVAKTAQEFHQLFQFDHAGVGSIHVESVMELDLIVLLATIYKRPVKVAFRYNPDVDAKTIEQISTGRKKDKFGLTREEILFCAHHYGSDTYVRIDGISIHIGSQITKTGPYAKAFKQLSSLCKEVEKHLGYPLSYVDIGGGIGVPYRNEETISLKAYGNLIRKYFKGYKKILLEPGRSLVANSGILVSEVVYSKIRPGNRTLILDAGMNDLMRPALYSAYHEIIPTELSREKKPIKWDVVGGICETTDYFARGRPLAVDGMPGEFVAFLSSGAYGFSMSNTYNSRPRVAEVLVDGSKVKLIRERETIEDLISHEIFKA
ncbi:MAG: diaminopimelate decarboxylase [Bdellovibrionales bacterium]|nr:diaminopimelate decarboxylase [Bdellovibrionales bacterium]